MHSFFLAACWRAQLAQQAEFTIIPHDSIFVNDYFLKVFSCKNPENFHKFSIAFIKNISIILSVRKRIEIKKNLKKFPTKTLDKNQGKRYIISTKGKTNSKAIEQRYKPSFLEVGKRKKNFRKTIKKA